MTAGLTRRSKEWSRPPEPHPPNAGIMVQPLRAATACELDLVHEAPGHGTGGLVEIGVNIARPVGSAGRWIISRMRRNRSRGTATSAILNVT